MKTISLIAAGAIACSFAANAADIPVYLDDSKPLEQRVEDALGRMTTEEKSRLFMLSRNSDPPGVKRLGIPEVWTDDGPHGVRPEVLWDEWEQAGWTNDSCVAFPALTCLAATWNPEMSYLYGKSLGEEARYRNKQVLLGPGVNIYRTPLNGRNFEYMGEDPYLASVLVVPYIKGMQQNGVGASVKHFALNNQELWRGHINVNLSDRALHEIYLPAFKSAVIDGDSWTIMGAYNKIRGQHACHNEMLLNKILKENWGYKGVVMTDWGGAHDTREAALYGLDLEMGSYTNGLTSESEFTTDDYYMARPYLEMLEKGELPMSTLDDKARRMLRLNFLTAMKRNKPLGSVASPEHYAVAEQIGNEAIVLLKNSPVAKGGNPLLPLSPALKSILVVGDNATRDLMKGGGSSELKVKDNVTPLAGLRALYGDKVKYAQGYRAGKPMYSHVEQIPASVQDSLRAEAVAMAKNADVVIMVGGLNKNHQQDCEAGDRESYALPFGQPEFIEALQAANPNLIVLLLSGNAVEMPWADKVPAVAQAWYLGSMAGKSIANVVSGKVNPSGKLPFSFPVRLEDNGAHSFGAISCPGDSINQEYLEDILVGYRWHDTKKIPARYSFGHGLSYTSFDYGKPVASAKTIGSDESLTITIPVRNTGDRDGKETVQLYIGDDKASVLRPLKELKGFEKIELAPGEEKTVNFTITPDALKFYDDKTASWVAEPGKFRAYIGSSSTDIRATVPFELK